MKRNSINEKHDIIFKKNTVILKGWFAWIFYLNLTIYFLVCLIKFFKIIVVTFLK